MTKPKVLITGASTGIGACYADRFAGRGHPLILTARNVERLEEIAEGIRMWHDVDVQTLAADLTDRHQRGRVEALLHDDQSVEILVNNAGAAAPGGIADVDLDAWQALIELNVVAPTMLAGALIPRLSLLGRGAIVNVGSVAAIAPETRLGVYCGTKAFVLSLSQSMQIELGEKGIYVQAVLPSATRTEIWERSGRDVNALGSVMSVGELVDAALVGFDRREAVTIPSLPDVDQWETFEAARAAMLPNFRQVHPADRYREQMPA